VYNIFKLFIIKGLFAKWKQPLYYDYDSPMTQELLFEVIAQLNDCGFEVVAIVSDMGPTNVRL